MASEEGRRMRRAAIAFIAVLMLVIGASAQGSVAITPDTVPEVLMLGTNGPGNAVAAAFSPNGKLVAVATTAGVKLYEVAAFGVEDILDGGGFPANGVAFSADGSQLVAVSMGYNVRGFDVNTGALVVDEYPDDLAGSMTSVALDPSGPAVAIGAGDAMNVYNRETRERLFQAIGFEGIVTQIAYSPDASMIATASSDGTTRIWNSTDGGFLVTLTGHTDRVSSVSWTPDGTQVFTASEDGTVRRWNALTGEELGTVYTHDGGGPMVAAMNPQGNLLVGDHHGELTFISGDNFEFVGLLGTQRGEIRAVAFSPDGRYAASVSADQVKLYDVATVSEIASVDFQPAYTALALSPDGAQFATGGADGALSVFNIGDDEPVHTFAIGMPVTSLALAADEILYVGSADSSVAVIDMHNSVQNEPLPGTAAVSDVTLHPSTPMLNAAMADNGLRWWSTETGEEFGTAYSHEAPATATAFSPDGVWMASADANGVIFVWSVETGDWSYTVEGAGVQVNDLAFSADSSLLAAALEDGRALIWQTDAPSAPSQTLAEFFGAVNTVAFSPDMSILAAGSDDGTMQLYNTADGAVLSKFYDHNAPVYGVAFSPDGTRIYSSGADGLVRTWGLP
jgi:WD40 repeat protein